MGENGDPRNGMGNESDGITAVLRAATTTQAKSELALQRDGFADARGIPLTDAERRVLQAMPEAQLEQMVDSLPEVLPPAPPPVSRAEMAVCGGMAPDMPLVRPSVPNMPEFAPHTELERPRAAGRPILWIVVAAVVLLALGVVLLALGVALYLLL